MKAYKGRTLEFNQLVKVYRNLHKNTFSIVDLKTGLVVAHSDTVRLANAEFIVHEAGRQRVLREKQKNVHAYVVGTYLGRFNVLQRHTGYYNPYETETFVTSTGEPLYRAAHVTLRDGGIHYTGRED